MRELADENDFILVYPQGTEISGAKGGTHWNAALPSETNKSSADDFGFVRAMIDTLSTQYNIDEKRIYACGYSNGSFFSYALACFMSDKIAAIGSVAGTMLDESYNNCSPTHPTAMINVHGTGDFIVPYNGGTGLTSINNVLNYWVSANQTVTTPAIQTDNSSGIEHHKYANESNGVRVEHYKIISGGHVWDDTVTYNGKNISRLIWEFLSQFNRDGLHSTQ